MHSVLVEMFCTGMDITEYLRIGQAQGSQRELLHRRRHNKVVECRHARCP